MRFALAARAAGLAVMLCLGVVVSASAQSAGGAVSNDLSMPPADEAPHDAQSPLPPPATAAKPKECVNDEAGFRQNGKRATFVVQLRNTCERRVRCTVNAYVVTAFGPKRGQKVLTLAPKSKGKGATKSYVIALKQSGGTANVSRKCVEL